jgi:hypothetical protein
VPYIALDQSLTGPGTPMFGEPQPEGATHMWIKSIVLAAALSAAVLDLAAAQSVDPDGANRGFPAYAQPGFSGYYNGMPQGPGAAAAANGQSSRPAALRKRR